MQHLSLLTAGWSYIPAGLMFGYLLMLPLPGLNGAFWRIYDETLYWPFIVAIITLLISVALTNGLKLNYRKCQFVHLYVMLGGAVLFLTSGLLFLLVKDVVPAIYLGACGLGLTLIPGLSFCHIRAPGRWRALYMGLCYFWFLAGIAATATIFLDDPSIWIPGTTVNETVHTNYSICLITGAIFTILLVAINEMLQREGIVDYKKPLDFDTDIAHESGKLMGQNERRNLYNNFTTPPVQTNGNAAKPWSSSTEQIIMGGANVGKNYHNLWVFYMIFTKLQGFVAFYYIFVNFAVFYASYLFSTTELMYGYSVFWFMVAGSLIGILAMQVLSPKIVFVIASVLHTVGLILAVSFYSTEAGWTHMGVSLIVFYTFIGVSLVIPAINILELASLNFNESFLAIGSIMELLAVALMQYFAVTNLSVYVNPWTTPTDIDKEVVAAHFISMIVLSVILDVIVLWHMPNTYHKSLAEIRSDLSRMTSYFAFSRMMVPVTQHTAMARTFSESVASEQPELEENRLSTRNGHLATRYNDVRSDDSTGRQSPYNNFSGTRLNRRTMIDRAQSPVIEREDPFLQEQLQRQHERNYILSRQQHYQYQARNSLESQQHSYHPERHSDFRQSRYIPEAEDYPQQRISEPPPQTRYNPPLLSRHQYYEEYTEERQQKSPTPQRPTKVLPVREPSITPSDRQSPVPSVVRRSTNPSATVKSEPGYVSRPRLLTQISEAPAPPPLPPADYLTKSLPRIKPDRQQSRESIHPVLVPKPPKPEEEIIPGVEYSHNLRPSEFLRQTRQSELYRKSHALT